MTQMKSRWNPPKKEVIQTCCAHMISYMTHLENARHVPTLNIMDNEASTALKQLLQKKHNSGTSISTPYPQKKRSGTCYTHILKPFCGRFGFSRKISYLYMVSNSEASGNYYEFTINTKNKWRVIGVCAKI